MEQRRKHRVRADSSKSCLLTAAKQMITPINCSGIGLHDPTQGDHSRRSITYVRYTSSASIAIEIGQIRIV